MIFVDNIVLVLIIHGYTDSACVDVYCCAIITRNKDRFACIIFFMTWGQNMALEMLVNTGVTKPLPEAKNHRRGVALFFT